MLNFNSNHKLVRQSLDKKSDRLGNIAQGLFLKVAVDWEREMVLNRFTGYSGHGVNTGSKLRNRSGALKSSIRTSPLRGNRLGDAGFIAKVGSSAAGYARIQETGKPRVIKPKRRRFLRIPLEGALYASGVERPETKPVRTAGGWKTAGGQRTFVKRSNDNQGVVFRDDGNGRATPLFVLKRSVKIKPRLGAKKTLMKVVKRHIPGISDTLALALRSQKK